MQSLALVVTWIHGCIGLNYWLRVKPWFPPLAACTWARWRCWFRCCRCWGSSPARARSRDWRRIPPGSRPSPPRSTWPSQDQVGFLYQLRDWLMLAFFAIVGGVFAARVVRTLATRRRAITVTYPDGKRVVIQPGTSLLEASRIGGIPHASVCGGRSRCSTCRVRVIEGAEALPPPLEEEQRVLARIHAAPSVRLACQARPTGAVTIQPLLPPQVTAPKALFGGDVSQGKEQEVAVLFADLRGFTSMAERRLPYDVVFLLNQYFRLTGESVDRGRRPCRQVHRRRGDGGVRPARTAGAGVGPGARGGAAHGARARDSSTPSTMRS